MVRTAIGLILFVAAQTSVPAQEATPVSYHVEILHVWSEEEIESTLISGEGGPEAVRARLKERGKVHLLDAFNLRGTLGQDVSARGSKLVVTPGKEDRPLYTDVRLRAGIGEGSSLVVNYDITKDLKIPLLAEGAAMIQDVTFSGSAPVGSGETLILASLAGNWTMDALEWSEIVVLVTPTLVGTPKTAGPPSEGVVATEGEGEGEAGNGKVLTVRFLARGLSSERAGAMASDLKQFLGNPAIQVSWRVIGNGMASYTVSGPGLDSGAVLDFLTVGAVEISSYQVGTE